MKIANTEGEKNMKVFSIEGKFEEKWRYSELPADFKGFFALEESGQIFGFFDFGCAMGYAKAIIKEKTNMSPDEVVKKFNIVNIYVVGTNRSSKFILLLFCFEKWETWKGGCQIQLGSRQAVCRLKQSLWIVLPTRALPSPLTRTT